MAQNSESNRGLIIVVVVVLALAVFASNIQPASTGYATTSKHMADCRKMAADHYNSNKAKFTSFRDLGLKRAGSIGSVNEEDVKSEAQMIFIKCVDPITAQKYVVDRGTPVKAQGSYAAYGKTARYQGVVSNY